MTKPKNPAAVLLGRAGGRKGGRNRVDALSDERIREIASNAAKARWARAKGADKVPKAVSSIPRTCPFCGAHDDVFCEGTSMQQQPCGGFRHLCTLCGALGPIAKTPVQAVNYWNHVFDDEFWGRIR